MWRAAHLLGEVAERGEDEDAHEDEEQEETELLAAVSECEGEGLGGRGKRVTVNVAESLIMGTVTLGLLICSFISNAMLSLSACLEAGRVPGELEDPEDASDPEDLDDAADVVEAAGGGVGLDEEDGDEVGQDGEHVDHVHPAADELPLLGGS